jgi:plasmid stabilization system protein ParE
VAQPNFLNGAIADLREIARHVAEREQDPARGAAFANRLVQACEDLARRQSIMGRPRPEIGRRSSEHAAPGVSHLLSVAEDRLDVVAIVHGARDLSSFFASKQPPAGES